MIVHLIDGTYELFRHFYGARRFNEGRDRPLGAVVGVLNTVLEMIEKGATHLGVATDHVIESFRNELWDTYKTGEGIEPALLAQFIPLEDALTAMGVTTWAMIELRLTTLLPRPRTSQPGTIVWRRCASGPRTRILPSASSATGWCRWTGRRTRSETPRASASSMESILRPFPISWRWSEMRPTDTRGS